MLSTFFASLVSSALLLASAGFMTDESYREPPATLNAPTPAPSVAPKPILNLPIIAVDSPNQDDRPTGMAIDTLIIHDTESPGIRKALTIANYFLNPSSQVSAHYIIGKAGEIVQCVPDERRAWHAGPSKFEGREKVNDFSIGIELVNDQTGHDPFTDAQYTSLIALTSDLVTRFNIPLTHITGHKNVTNFPSIKRDPAENFDWERLLVGVTALRESRQIVRIVTPAVPVGLVGGSGR